MELWWQYCVRHYGRQCCFPESVIKLHCGQIPGVVIWGALSNCGRYNLLRIEGNLNSNRYFRELLLAEVMSFSQCIAGAIFGQDNDRPRTTKTVINFSLPPTHATSFLAYLFAGYIAYWAHVGFGCSASGSASCSFKRQILTAHSCKFLFSSTSRHSKSICFMLRRTAAHIALRSGYNKYWFWTFICIFYLLWKFRHFFVLIQKMFVHQTSTNSEDSFMMVLHFLLTAV